ncbi:YafY family transcriptional regulator [Chromobacterium violaceum]|uniref:helix-turn-helix transcriptional regulator n=1 Tax=Chromobacterium violaceum TaxID=536 RepID=UPI0009DAB184|nr:YafY family protein [Chromobacterium violaceum]MBP4049701.1 YafY family transcriptional regulator [Chromobacterium violaceum]MCD0494394.1 YafY family transcriptional regulator [Chromobacterium violaceum]OQS28654.1 transcriptional regulator [Chromobacterium violaceum]
MARSERLLALLQLLRRYRRPVTAQTLADELDVSVRTVYRDIASLQLQGADIAGEPGMGYQLRPGFLLPPLMFAEEEIEALVLGMRWVEKRADSRLAGAAGNALAKVAAVLPDDLRRRLEDETLLVGPAAAPGIAVDMAALRDAIRQQRKLVLSYRDVNGGDSRRVVWPFALGFFEKVQVLAAWCELRQDFRHFRCDRILRCESTEDRYPRRRQALLREWRQRLGIAGPA